MWVGEDERTGHIYLLAVYVRNGFIVCIGKYHFFEIIVCVWVIHIVTTPLNTRENNGHTRIDRRGLGWQNKETKGYKERTAYAASSQRAFKSGR